VKADNTETDREPEQIPESPAQDREEPEAGGNAQEEEPEETVEVSLGELESLKQEHEDLNDRFLRLAAEFDNYRKRIEKEKTLWEISASKRAMGNMLLVFTSVIRGLETGDDSRAGLEAIRDQINAIFESEGVSIIPAENEPFDPDLHEAVFMEETDQVPEKTVLEEIEPGYMYRGTVLRPAKVKVSRKPAAEHRDPDEKKESDSADREQQ
jgi:molecular chaperone GrpE